MSETSSPYGRWFWFSDYGHVEDGKGGEDPRGYDSLDEAIEAYVEYGGVPGRGEEIRTVDFGKALSNEDFFDSEWLGEEMLERIGERFADEIPVEDMEWPEWDSPWRLKQKGESVPEAQSRFYSSVREVVLTWLKDTGQWPPPWHVESEIGIAFTPEGYVAGEDSVLRKYVPRKV